MRALLVLMLVDSAHAAPSKLTIANSALWPSHPKAIAVRISGSGWVVVRKDRTVKGAALAAPPEGKAVAIDVKAPHDGTSSRRWAVVLPDHAYKIVGNPCAHYGLEVDGAEGDSRLRVDASALPQALFPLVISTDHSDDGEPTADAMLDRPGVSAAIDLPVSAMCARSGTSLVVYSQATKRRLFDESVIAHPGALHTLALGKRGGFTITVAR
jgi:hypothetical protein